MTSVRPSRYGAYLAVATKNIVSIDSVEIFTMAVVRPGHENSRPPPPVHPDWTVPKPRPLAPRNSGASATACHGKPNTTQATPISLGSTAVPGLAVPPVAGLPADTAGIQTGYPDALAPQGLSPVLDVEVPLPTGRASPITLEMR
jgi:hypothetical protein